jgi:hypothetical protein
MIGIRKKYPRIALIIGHDQSEKGAVCITGESEYDYWSKVLIPLRQMTNIFVLSRNHGGVKGAYEKAREILADYILEFHFNAFDSKVYGCEVLYNINTNLELATIVNQEIVDTLNCNNRGTKKVNNGDRGFQNLKSVPNACLVEMFFGDNPNDYINHERARYVVTNVITAVQDRFYVK